MENPVSALNISDFIWGIADDALRDVYVRDRPENTDPRDTERVLHFYYGGGNAFLGSEALPHAPDAWYDPAEVKIGYEISFTRHFYKAKPLLYARGNTRGHSRPRARDGGPVVANA